MMGHSDDWDSDRPGLPPEAGNQEVLQFEPNDDWIKEAPPKLQIAAMRRWFYDHYEDPANETPYDGREGGYQFIWGGPYDPNDEIQNRFSEVVPYDVMERLILDLYRDVGHEWAPKHPEIDYFDDLSMIVIDRANPFRMLCDRLTEIDDVLTVNGSPSATQLATKLAYSAVVTALESYLWDTVAYWAENNSDALRAIVTTNKDFQALTMAVSTVFDRMDGIKAEVLAYLQDQIWHRLDKIRPMMQQGLAIRVPEIGDLMRAVLVRHDIIHRGGRSKNGEPITVAADDVRELAQKVKDFAKAIEAELIRRFPTTNNVF